jgi:hypothetical protein
VPPGNKKLNARAPAMTPRNSTAASSSLTGGSRASRAA